MKLLDRYKDFYQYETFISTKLLPMNNGTFTGTKLLNFFYRYNGFGKLAWEAWQLGILNRATPPTAAGSDRPTSHTHGALPLSNCFPFLGFPTWLTPWGSLSFVWLFLLR